jgi:hypothetical protein
MTSTRAGRPYRRRPLRAPLGLHPRRNYAPTAFARGPVIGPGRFEPIGPAHSSTPTGSRMTLPCPREVSLRSPRSSRRNHTGTTTRRGSHGRDISIRPARSPRACRNVGPTFRSALTFIVSPSLHRMRGRCDRDRSQAIRSAQAVERRRPWVAFVVLDGCADLLRHSDVFPDFFRTSRRHTERFAFKQFANHVCSTASTSVM